MVRETAAEENSTAYFPLLDRIAEGRFADCGTDEELYSTFLQVVKDDGHITDPAALSSFAFALSIHSSAPRIEAHYHFYATSVEPTLMAAQDAACPVWVHFDGKQYCSPALDRAQQDVGLLKYSLDMTGQRGIQLTQPEPLKVYRSTESCVGMQARQVFLQYCTQTSRLLYSANSTRRSVDQHLKAERHIESVIDPPSFMEISFCR